MGDGRLGLKDAQAWSVYVLLSATGKRTYVGISTDPARRLLQHNGEQAGGARSTRSGRPWTIARILGPFQSRAGAQRVEHELKTRRGKQRLTAELA